jgi:hypothetical protein
MFETSPITRIKTLLADAREIAENELPENSALILAIIAAESISVEDEEE